MGIALPLFNVFLKHIGIVLYFDLELRRGSWGLLKITKWKIAEKFQGHYENKKTVQISKEACLYEKLFGE